MAILVVRFVELRRARPLGVPFAILAGVNLFTAGSVELHTALGPHGVELLAAGLGGFNLEAVVDALARVDLHRLLDGSALAGHLAAFAFTAWGVGHLHAGRHEHRATTAQRVRDNPQTYYGAGDLAAVNSAGHINPYALPFMLAGFVRSLVIRPTVAHRGRRRVGGRLANAAGLVTAARLYGTGYLIGALTTLTNPTFALAQILWALGYFSFK